MTDLADIQLQDLSKEQAIHLLRIAKQQLQANDVQLQANHAQLLAKDAEIAALRCVAACCKALKAVLDGCQTNVPCGAEALAVTTFWSL